MKLEKYSFGCGDRFFHQGKPQLEAIIAAKDLGIDIVARGATQIVCAISA
jgi:tagaturonate epimerase